MISSRQLQVTTKKLIIPLQPYFRILRTVQPRRCNVSQFIYFCKTLYIFQTIFPSIIRSSKLHIQRQVFVGPLLLPAASLAGMELQYWSDKHLTLCVQFSAPDDGRKNRLKHVERLTEINILWNVASCWLYSANILAMHGPNVQNMNISNCTVQLSSFLR